LQLCSANPTHNNPVGDYALSWGFFIKKKEKEEKNTFNDFLLKYF
jgi:hypothetical protein